MRNAFAMLSCAALAVLGCGKSTGSRGTDSGSRLDAAAASGGTTGTSGTGSTGTASSGGSASSVSAGAGGSSPGTSASAPGGSGGTTAGGGSASATSAGGAGGTPSAGSSGTAATGGASKDGGVSDPKNAVGSGGSDATSVDTKQFCEMWQTRATEQDTLDVLQYGFFKAGTVLEGTLGDLVESGSTTTAALTVNRVRAGISRYEGLVSDVRIDRPLYELLGKGAKVTLGFKQTHPLQDTGAARPVWEEPLAAIAKSSALPADVFDFHAWITPNVAVVRVEEILDGGFRLALVESLRGNLPAVFLISVSEMWPPLGLSVGSIWIGGFSELITTPTPPTPSVTLLELRPNTTEARASVTTALQALEPQGFATRYQAELDRQKADALRLRLGWMYNQAEVVAALEVTGIANECCTDAGGLFHESSVFEVLAGQKPTGHVLTGGHGYYVQKACGDRFLYAMSSALSLPEGFGLGCSGKGTLSPTTHPASGVLHELAATAENLALARQWVGSGPPLLRLYPAGKDFAAGAFAPPAATALWSTPVAALTAVMAGTPAIFTIVNATPRAEGTVVRMRTPFYADELTSLELREIEVAFACADPRLLQIGARWLGIVVGTETFQAKTVVTPLEQGHLWLVPGLLLPERSDLKRTLRLIPSVVVK